MYNLNWLEGDNAKYFNWAVEGGSFSQMSTDSNQVEIIWDSNAFEHGIFVQSFSELDAAGDSLFLSIHIADSDTSTFMGIDSIWENTLNWDLGHVPDVCEDVMIQSSNGIQTMDINSKVEINSIQLGLNMTLNILVDGILDVNQKGNNPLHFSLDNKGVVTNEGSIILKSKIPGKQLNLNNGQISNQPGASIEILKN